MPHSLPENRWSTRMRHLVQERPRLLMVYLLAVALNSLSFYWIPPGYYEPGANLLHAVLILALLPLTRRPALLPLAVHGATALSVLLIFYIASQTGGVNSSSLVWFSVLAVAVLMLQGARAMTVWIVLILAAILGLQSGIERGWIDPVIHGGAEGVPWAWMNHMMAVLSLIAVVMIYEYLHRRQLGELETRNAELRRTHHALIQAQAHKDEFVAAVGHELRTPMNAILGFNSVLHRELADRPEQTEVVEHIRRSTLQLLQVVNDILDFSQLQAGRLALHPQDYSLAMLVREALHRFELRAQHKGLALTADIDPALPAALHGDRQRVLQILHHLLDNALKFTDQGRVQLRLLQQQDRLRIEVQDTGRGIAPERQPHIFNRFEHADLQTNRAYGGTGLGLALCERLAHLLGGEIGVQSQPGEGALFWLQLPMQAAHGDVNDEALQAEDFADEAPLRLLVVDDNPVNLQVARLQLRKIWPQAQIATAGSAAEALVLLDTEAYDLALVDMVMPDMDGLQLTRQIRQQFPALTARMPILALTANTNPVEREQCLAAGMDDVLHKPMDTEALRRAVLHHVRKARA